MDNLTPALREAHEDLSQNQPTPEVDEAAGTVTLRGLPDTVEFITAHPSLTAAIDDALRAAILEEQG